MASPVSRIVVVLLNSQLIGLVSVNVISTTREAPCPPSKKETSNETRFWASLKIEDLKTVAKQLSLRRIRCIISGSIF